MCVCVCTHDTIYICHVCMYVCVPHIHHINMKLHIIHVYTFLSQYNSNNVPSPHVHTVHDTDKVHDVHMLHVCNNS